MTQLRGTAGHQMPQEERRLAFIREEVRDRYLPELDAQVWAARKGAYRYKSVGGVIGVLTIVSAGVAAVTAILGDVSNAITAISAALAALLSAAQQTLAPVENSRRVRQEAAEWEDMARDFRHFLNFTLLQEPYDEAHRKRFDELLRERGELVRKFVGMSPNRIPLPAKELLDPHPGPRWLDRLIWRRRPKPDQRSEPAEPPEPGRDVSGASSASTDSAAVVAAIVAVVASVVVAEKEWNAWDIVTGFYLLAFLLAWTWLRSRRVVLVLAYLACVGVIGASIVGITVG